MSDDINFVIVHENSDEARKILLHIQDVMEANIFTALPLTENFVL